MADQNWFLIFITVVVVCLVFAANIYVIVHFQHPEDKNQAWFPKAIVLIGLSLASCEVRGCGAVPSRQLRCIAMCTKAIHAPLSAA